MQPGSLESMACRHGEVEMSCCEEEGEGEEGEGEEEEDDDEE